MLHNKLQTTPQEIFLFRLFEEPLVPISAEPTLSENAALANALSVYSQCSGSDDFSSLTNFLEAYPTSPWNAALLTNLGIEYYNRGYCSKTLDVWGQAWELAKDVTDLPGQAIANRAVGELVYMYGRLGRMAELDALLQSIEGRAFFGPATEKIAGSREGLVNMLTRPGISFRCGPLALHRIMLAVCPDNPQSELIDATVSTQQGFSLCQVAEISQRIGLDYRIAFREQGAEFITPSVVHFKLDHFAAVLRREGDRYLLQDPTFKNDVWVTSSALEAEASGYFLIPPEKFLGGWRSVSASEAETIYGKGNVPNPSDPPGPSDPSTDSGNSCTGMAVARIHLLNASLNINDEPVGYSPPVGSAVRFNVRYNQRDDQFSSSFNYSNFGAKWTFDWLSYIKDDPTNPLTDVKYYIMGGGNRSFTGFNAATRTYAFQLLDQTRLIRTSPNSYEMLSRDGSKKIFNQSDGAVGGTMRRVFLTQSIDPYGNVVSLTYDASLRVTAITDAIGQVTILSYDLPADIFKITKVTDPFGRFATFEYDASNRLIQITDVLGLTSEFTYEVDGVGGTKSDFITVLTTPYGVTKFTKNENGTTRSLEILYPDGERELVAFDQNSRIPASDPPQSLPVGMAVRNDLLGFRNTYHWDRQGCAYAYGDYTKARIYHWLHSTDLQSPVGILESVKEPLEGRVWYEYAGQTSSNGPIVIGSSNKPIRKGRVLDDGSTQLYKYEYNDFGNVIKEIDPVGRTFSYIYAENGIDLLEVRQTRDGQNELLSQTVYNSKHLPLTQKDIAGQTTTYTYNARGQLLTETNARGDTTTYNYNVNGYRTSVDGPLGAGDTTTWTYDAIGRVRSTTDVSGYTLTFDYDNFDRLTKITYPDTTFDRFTYTLLDRTLMQDRAGRQTSYEYNSIRQNIKQTDPLNRVTLYAWCKCGALKILTDPMGRTTTWRHDLQGRVKSKEYVGGSQVIYRYDNASRLRQRIDEKLQVTQYSYYWDNVVSQICYTNATVTTPPVSYTYDANYSRITSMTDGIGTTVYRYIPIAATPALGAGQLASIDGTLPNDTITYAYDELGRRVSTAINGVTSSLTYDAAGRITKNINALGVFNTTYDGVSNRVASQIYPNGQTTEFTYASNLQDRHLQRISNKRGITPISEFIYGHNIATGQIVSWSQQADTQTPEIYNFTYDLVNQLTAASASVGGVVVNNFNYSYDPASNLLTEQIGTAMRQFSYNALNELTSIEGDTSDPVTYRWDVEQRLTAIDSGNKNTQFTYDGFGRRVGIRELLNDVEVSNHRFVWCGNEICEERNSMGTVVKRYFPQGMKLETGVVTGNFFYTRDHLGSVREVIDNVGNIREKVNYDPFGKRILDLGDVDSDFGYTGHFYHADKGFYLTKFRAYDPRSARWLSRDPMDNAEILLGSNLYHYVNNNPINLVDIDGRGDITFDTCFSFCVGAGGSSIGCWIKCYPEKLKPDPVPKPTETPDPISRPHRPPLPPEGPYRYTDTDIICGVIGIILVIDPLIIIVPVGVIIAL
jgi:RHS repeat-associated protein